MSKKRASLKGRGNEILFGELEAMSLVAEPQLDDRALNGQTMEDAFYAEVIDDYAPDPEAEDGADRTAGIASTVLPASAESPGSPESDSVPMMVLPSPDEYRERSVSPTAQASAAGRLQDAVLSEVLGTERAPEPQAAELSPSTEVPMEEQMQVDTDAFAAAPSSSESDYINVLPARDVWNRTFSNERVGPSEFEHAQPVEDTSQLPDRDLTLQQRTEMLDRLGKDRVLALERDLDEQFDAVIAIVGVNESLTQECHNLLMEARDIVINLELEKLAKAEANVERVRGILERASQSSQKARRYGWLLTLWALVWFGPFLFVFLRADLVIAWLGRLGVEPVVENILDLRLFVPTLAAGGIGGVAAVFYALTKHISARDFDPSYTLSYIFKPFMGLILGAIIFLVVHAGTVALGVAPVPGSEEVSRYAIYPYILYVIALAAGLREDLAFNMLSDAVKTILGRKREETVSMTT
jgi:hypothetical protein